MSACPDRGTLLQGLLDGELDAAHALEAEAHLRSCPGCSAYFNALQALRVRLGEVDLSPRAPPRLRTRIEAMIDAERRRSPAPWRWLSNAAAGWAAAGAMAAVAAASLLLVQTSPVTMAGLEDQLVAGHIRSLLANHLTDVATSDRHTVKPWFNGRIDYAPPVPDLAADGYPLAGGRLDYAGNRVVAALVYRRRAHVINLFVVPHDREAASKTAARHDTYSVVHWTQSGLDFWAVSDVEAGDLEAFRQAFVRATPP